MFAPEDGHVGHGYFVLIFLFGIETLHSATCNNSIFERELANGSGAETTLTETERPPASYRNSRTTVN